MAGWNLALDQTSAELSPVSIQSQAPEADGMSKKVPCLQTKGPLPRHAIFLSVYPVFFSRLARDWNCNRIRRRDCRIRDTSLPRASQSIPKLPFQDSEHFLLASYIFSSGLGEPPSGPVFFADKASCLHYKGTTSHALCGRASPPR